jgi:hypothetical protein
MAAQPDGALTVHRAAAHFCTHLRVQAARRVLFQVRVWGLVHSVRMSGAFGAGV